MEEQKQSDEQATTADAGDAPAGEPEKSLEQPKAKPAPSRFGYVRYDELSVAKQETLKAKFEELEQLVSQELADGRPKSLVFTALEEAYMWVGKAIRDNQIKRGGDATHQPARGEG